MNLAKLVVMDTETGKVVQALDSVGGADDITMTRQPDAFTSQGQLARWPCLRRLTRTTSSFSEKFPPELYRKPAFGYLS